VIHSAVHGARHDVDCVIHTHTLAGMAVSAMKATLQPLAQSAMRFAEIAYHDYEGPAFNLEERERLVKDLGEREAMILRNHGLLTVGRSVPDAFLTMYFLESACKIQIDAQRGGELTLIDPRILEGMEQTMKVASAGQGPGIAWPALLRKLEREDASYKT
jgi:ribulose-5-phosphate 4-epimerase/fuculose-1-phosphate aldolase